MSAVQYGKRKIFCPESFVYTIPDIHSQSERLRCLLSKLPLTSEDHIVFTGDLLNSTLPTSDPYGTLNLVLELKNKYPHVYVVEGNHDEAFTTWLRTGLLGGMYYPQGQDTISKLCEKFKIISGEIFESKSGYFFDSYVHTELKKALIESGLLSIYEQMIPYYETEKMIVTHSPIDRRMFGIFGGFSEKNLTGILDRMEFELKWTNTEEDSDHLIPEIKKLLVCGHQYASHKKPRMFKSRVFLDVGCGKIPDAPAISLRFPKKKIFY